MVHWQFCHLKQQAQPQMLLDSLSLKRAVRFFFEHKIKRSYRQQIKLIARNSLILAYSCSFCSLSSCYSKVHGDIFQSCMASLVTGEYSVYGQQQQQQQEATKCPSPSSSHCSYCSYCCCWDFTSALRLEIFSSYDENIQLKQQENAIWNGCNAKKNGSLILSGGSHTFSISPGYIFIMKIRILSEADPVLFGQTDTC